MRAPPQWEWGGSAPVVNVVEILDPHAVHTNVCLRMRALVFSLLRVGGIESDVEMLGLFL